MGKTAIESMKVSVSGRLSLGVLMLSRPVQDQRES